MDEFIGNHYESQDSREAGRVIEVLSYSEVRRKYMVKNITNPNNPFAVGHKSWVSAKNLRLRWTKVSH